jgi:uncharacterized membrane protein
MLTLTHIYWLTGIYLAYITWQSLQDKSNSRRLGTSSFWGLLSISFLFGDVIPSIIMGILVIAIAALAASGAIARGNYSEVSPEQRQENALKFGHKLFIPALMIPLVTLFAVLFLKNIHIGDKLLLSSDHTTVISLGLACLVAFVFALKLTGEKLPLAIQSSRGILDAIGWAALLPLLLAMLGAIFNKAGIGNLVADLLTQTLPLQYVWVSILAYGLGMVLFTMIMGNAFAAFPVMTLGIALPILVQQHGANPAPLAAIGMLTGYCGTLMTPMAANFNIVPAALLELKNTNSVIKAQIMTALPLILCNLLLMYWLVFL